jgi:putative nucleotidyltransferase with HDIG domain
MTLEPTLEELDVLADTRRRAASHHVGSELTAEVVVGGSFVAALAVLISLGSSQSLSPMGAILSVAVMVLATRVKFETPLGFTVATQLAFVPMLFVMPPALVPLAVTVALAIALIPGIVTGKVPANRLLRCPTNALFSVGPALVFALASTPADNAGPALLLAALGAQFFVDFSAATIYFGIARGASLRSQVSDSWVYVIDAALSGVGLVVAEQMRSDPSAVVAVVPLLGLLAMFARERQGRLGSLLELKETYRGTALLLGDVISGDDGYTGEHSQGVVGLALTVGEQLGLDPECQRNLEFGALLHDVGKIAIPKEIITKPGKLDPHEWAIIKTHPAEGERMLQRVGGFMLEVGQIVRSHHERWDGGGYPDGLVGEAIPVESRIISCCDAWNAMRTDRPYRRAMPLADALQQMHDNSGTQFDPGVVRALVTVVEAQSPAQAAPAEPESAAPTPAPSPAAADLVVRASVSAAA